MNAPRIGSLFSGAGMLDEGVRAVLGGSVAWHSEVDPAACKVLAHRYPDVPNLGDVTAVDWSQVEPVDVLTGGSPCQDVSHAGKRAGMRAGTRSGLWAAMVDAIDILRPAMVVWENVRGVLSAEADSALEPCAGCMGDGDDGAVLRALGRVLGDLADLGYDTQWHGLRAADVGAPHGRFRVFVVAWPSDTRMGRSPGGADLCAGESAAGWSGAVACDTANVGHERSGRAGTGRPGSTDGRIVASDADSDALRQQPVTERRSGGEAVAGLARSDVATDAHDSGRQGTESAQRPDLPARSAPADAACDGRDEGRPEPAQIIGRPDAAQRSDAATDTGSDGRDGHPQQDSGQITEREETRGRDDAHGRTVWGQYEPAVRRWERLTRTAPSPTEAAPKGGQRLSPRFVEWMMGLPAGWVTDVPGVSRNEQLKALGNGVVPQQAAEALRRILATAQAVAA